MRVIEPKRFYAAMIAMRWSSLRAGGIPLEDGEDENGVCRFIPLFTNKRKAQRFAGKDRQVMVLEVCDASD